MRGHRIIKTLYEGSDIAASLVGLTFLDAELELLLMAMLRSSTVTEELLTPDRGLLGTYSAKWPTR